MTCGYAPCASGSQLGQVAQIPFHLNRAMDKGLTRAQASEVIAHIAFYAGWPNAFSAAPVVKNVFNSRSK
jgi:4-carboxymuconolactone decarboxylase